MRNIKNRAEEMMSKMSEQLEIPYSPTMISILEGILIEYREEVLKLINGKIFLLKKSIEKCKDKGNEDYDEIQIPMFEGKLNLIKELKREITED